MSKAARTKQLIIDKSAILFNTKGFAGTSLSDILKETKLAKGSLYVHFENKEAIAHAVIDYYTDRQLQLLEATLTTTQSAQAKLFAYLNVFLDPENPSFEGGCPFLNLGMETDDTDQVACGRQRCWKNRAARLLGTLQSVVPLCADRRWGTNPLGHVSRIDFRAFVRRAD